jgi:hypothetical protein
LDLNIVVALSKAEKDAALAAKKAEAERLKAEAVAKVISSLLSYLPMHLSIYLAIYIYSSTQIKYNLI